ncbi:unnamed protein product [Prunus brigantina]
MNTKLCRRTRQNPSIQITKPPSPTIPNCSCNPQLSAGSHHLLDEIPQRGFAATAGNQYAIEFFAPETVLNCAQRDSVSKGDNVSDNLVATENKMVNYPDDGVISDNMTSSDVVEDQKVEMQQNLTELEGSVQATRDDGFANGGTTIDSVE